VIDDQSLASHRHRQPAIAKATPAFSQRQQLLTQLAVDDLAMSVMIAGWSYAGDPTGATLTHSSLVEGLDRKPFIGGVEYFFDSAFFNPAMSRCASANSFLRLPFSSSSWRIRRTSLVCMPAYLPFHL
jgi:hypothetical protein